MVTSERLTGIVAPLQAGPSRSGAVSEGTHTGNLVPPQHQAKIPYLSRRTLGFHPHPVAAANDAKTDPSETSLLACAERTQKVTGQQSDHRSQVLRPPPGPGGAEKWAGGAHPPPCRLLHSVLPGLQPQRRRLSPALLVRVRLRERRGWTDERSQRLHT